MCGGWQATYATAGSELEVALVGMSGLLLVDGRGQVLKHGETVITPRRIELQCRSVERTTQSACWAAYPVASEQISDLLVGTDETDVVFHPAYPTAGTQRAEMCNSRPQP